MIKVTLSTLLFICVVTLSSLAQTMPALKLDKDPWTDDQLIEPSTLASLINSPKGEKPFIYNIGVVDDIKGAKHLGGVKEEENLQRFKKAISALPKDANVVVYCGCCPFSRCPNIRPAFQALQDAGLVNGKLLNLPTNIKVDWINKGYPLEK